MHLLGGGDRLDEIVAELRKYEGWPVDDTKDRRLVKDLGEKYPAVDLMKEAFAWRVWMEDHQQKKEVKPRARFVTWIGNSTSFGNARKGAGANRRNQSRTAPAGRDAFGRESSQSLGGW